MAISKAKLFSTDLFVNNIAFSDTDNFHCATGVSVYELLNEILEKMVMNEILESMKQEMSSPFLAALTKDIHVLPDFHGNRLSHNSSSGKRSCAAILGAVASKMYSTVREAMQALNAPGRVVYSSHDPKVRKYHDTKCRIFRDLYQQQLSQRAMIKEALSDV
ncbi:uncharacterized protein LOC121800960 [Salvia splendens]|uniref:uncharacterized protein LOC121800960 n=1 Tax=Salvia splendens TaxID=180675 RepID=UPI001C26C347|nr:uncharacterized protein LOC121800960 [Salvia splendens]